jgi:tagaturonate reductase
MTAPHPASGQRVLQFGTGRFLRGFIDAFLDEENADSMQAPQGDVRWRVTVVESSGSGVGARLAARGCRYRLLVRGLEEGRTVDSAREIGVIDRAIDAAQHADAVMAAALDPLVSMVVSNTTEAGYAPDRLPARLSLLLEGRARTGLPGVTILPCELVEDNGRRLRELVRADARRRDVPASIVDHIDGANQWTVTLVDRITTSPGPDDERALGDPFAVVVEPYASWVVEAPAAAVLPRHAAVERTSSVLPFALRKIRILNGAHTALVARTRDLPVSLVREALERPDVAEWLEGLLTDEVVPALGDRIVDGDRFVRLVLERFHNPFQDHQLSDIAVGHANKLAVRLLPTYHDYVARFGKPPSRLHALLAAEGVVP